MQPWMEDVFVRAEKKQLDHEDAQARPNQRIRVGKSVFLILLGFIALRVAYLFIKRRNLIKRSSKRKNSEDWHALKEMFKDEEMTVLPVNEHMKIPRSVV